MTLAFKSHANFQYKSTENFNSTEIFSTIVPKFTYIYNLRELSASELIIITHWCTLSWNSLKIATSDTFRDCTSAHVKSNEYLKKVSNSSHNVYNYAIKSDEEK